MTPAIHTDAMDNEYLQCNLSTHRKMSVTKFRCFFFVFFRNWEMVKINLLLSVRSTVLTIFYSLKGVTHHI